MVEYIKQIAQDLLSDPPQATPLLVLRALSEELERLDPRDFLPAAQADLVRLRISLKSQLGHSEKSGMFFDTRALAKMACEVLDLYGGDGSRSVSRGFVFVTNPDLRIIIERDYRELTLKLLPSGAWKSTVVMAGSILEAILFDMLAADAAVAGKALAAAHAPKKLDLKKGEWKLHHLIEVAVELGKLPSNRADAIDIILRDYRNFIHPMKEMRAQHPCTEAEAFMAKGALDSVCNHLTPP